jgi:tetratricopeptide (TPR) repeat protein
LVVSAAFAQGDGLPSGQAQPPQAAVPQDREAAASEASKQALAPKPAPEAMRKQKLDALLDLLHDARKPEEARQIAMAIERLWLQSSSDTANVLMQRAAASIEAQNFALALSLLDKLVALEPDWAEAWNKRATARYLINDMDGAMADINHVIRLEPRHFGALTGMALILQREGFDNKALDVLNKALAIYPLAPDIRELAEKLALEVEGRDL